MHGSYTTRDPIRLVHVHMCMPLPIGADDMNKFHKQNSGLKIAMSVQGTFEAPSKQVEQNGCVFWLVFLSWHDIKDIMVYLGCLPL